MTRFSDRHFHEWERKSIDASLLVIHSLSLSELSPALQNQMWGAVLEGLIN